MAQIRVLEVGGSPGEMGYRHGLAYAEAIRELTDERLRLSSDPHWTGRKLSREQVLALAEACLAEHRAYAPELVEELAGVAAATGLDLPGLLVMNGFTDFIDVVYNRPHSPVEATPAPPAADDCTAAIVPDSAAAGSQGFLAQTWDMHRTATPYVFLLRGRPAAGPAFLTFTITGCVGMIGLNEAGIAVGINNLHGADGRPGVTWPFVVRKILAQTNLDDALACLTGARLAGAHNYLLADGEGRGFNVEAMGTRYHVEAVRAACAVHTNHCLAAGNRAVERPRLPAARASSKRRLNRATALLARRPVTLEALMALTRDRNGICVLAEAPTFVETCGAAIMRPATREMWAVWGLPTGNDYERFVV